MKCFKVTTASFLITVTVAFACGGNALAATITATDCSYSAVSAAIGAASVGDQVAVPSGSCTWNSTLQINKGVQVIGAGVGKTVITANANPMISIDPTDRAGNKLIRVSGFTFDLNNGQRTAIEFPATTSQIPHTKTRIDHNRFQNIAQGSTQWQFIHFSGLNFGVIDNNYFTAAYYTARANLNTGAGNSGWWKNVAPIRFGENDNNMWFEDNTINVAGDGGVIDCVESFRYAFRYNQINVSNGQPVFDSHGNWGNQNGCFGGEIYGNIITGGGRALDQRGGRFYVFNNATSSGTAYIQVRDEQDGAYQNGKTYDISGYVGPGAGPCPRNDSTCMDVVSSYYWGNRAGLAGSLWSYSIGPNCVGADCSQNTTRMPVAGRDFFMDAATTPGVGAGPLASRPSTCTPSSGSPTRTVEGQAYWATNQSTTNLAGMVGPNPATPISGTLYRCIATNKWDAGSSPLPYPHPLRNEGTTVTGVTPPSGLSVR